MKREAALAALTLAGASPLSAAADPARYMSAELIAETLQPAAGSTILVGLRMTPRPGWHGYWSNPGDSGIAPSVRWSAPKGVTFGPLRHPAPVLLNAQGVSSFVHDGPHVLLSRMSLPRSLTPGAAIPIVADLSWAACTATQCVPLRAKLHLQLTAGTGLPGPEAAAIHAAADEVPRAAPNGSFIRTANGIRLQFPAALKLDPRDARFFAEEPSAFDTAGARPDLVDGRLVISADAPGKTPPTLAGVVSDGRSSYRVALFQSREAVAPSAAASPKPIESRSPTNPHEVGQSAAPQRPAQPRAEHSTLSAFVMWALAGAAAATGAAAFVILRRRI